MLTNSRSSRAYSLPNAKALVMTALFTLLLILPAPTSSTIFISELMYNPRWKSSWFSYVELYNAGDAAADISGWSFSGITYVFPPGTSIGPNSFLVVARNRTQLLQGYTYLSSSQVYGEYNGTLSSNGERIRLLDNLGGTRASVTYSPDAPWPQLANGLGSSIELVCFEAAKQGDVNYWEASPLPADPDPHVEFGGSPGRPPFYQNCDSWKPQKTPRLIFSEILYAIPKSVAYEELHEFLEIYNREDFAVDLSHWRIVSAKGVRFTFPVGSSIQAKSLAVICKDHAAFTSSHGGVADYGPYLNDLSNGGDTLALVSPNAQVSDLVAYDDAGDWPLAADGLGGSQAELPENHPYKHTYDSYAYKGISLHRRSQLWTGKDAYNWKADDPSPHSHSFEDSSSSSSLLPPPPIISRTVSPQPKFIFDDTTITIMANLLPWPISSYSVLNATLEWWTYDGILLNSSSPHFISMIPGNTIGSMWNATIPPHPTNTIFRYRFHFFFSSNSSITSVSFPRWNDPYEYYMLFVYPRLQTSTDHFHLFINPAQWSTLFTNAQSGRIVNNCDLNPLWDQTIRGVLSFDGLTVDIQTRYQGSRYNRVNGRNVGTAWEGMAAGVGPTSGTLRAWSWRIDLPKYGPMKNRGKLLFHKMLQGCVFYETPLMLMTADDAGFGTAAAESFLRLHINGFYFRYYLLVIEQEEPERLLDLHNENCWHLPTQKEGHYFKVQGSADEGPYAAGNMNVLSLNPLCPSITLMDRYDATFSRKSHKDWQNSEQIKILAELMAYARSNLSDVKRVMDENFDIDLFINYAVTFAYAGTWDQTIHNQYCNKRREDGKWTWHPWDADNLWGTHTSYNQVTASLRAGRDVQVQYTRYSLYDAYWPEIQERFRLAVATFLSPSVLTDRLNIIRSRINMTEVLSSAGGFSQDWEACYTNHINFFTNRSNYVTSQLGSYSGADPWGAYRKVTCPSLPVAVKVYNQFKGVPFVVYGIHMRNSSSSHLEIAWNASYDGGDPITAYIVERSEDNTTWTVLNNSLTSTSYNDATVISGKTYQYRIAAVNSFGHQFSDPAAFPVPSDCLWHPFSEWSTCSLPCGTGQQTRNRTFTPATHGGLPCVGEAEEVQNCNTNPCPVDCQWLEWSQWSPCTATCLTTGLHVRVRDQIKQEHGGLPCPPGSFESSRPCVIDCDFNGGVGTPRNDTRPPCNETHLNCPESHQYCDLGLYSCVPCLKGTVPLPDGSACTDPSLPSCDPTSSSSSCSSPLMFCKEGNCTTCPKGFVAHQQPQCYFDPINASYFSSDAPPPSDSDSISAAEEEGFPLAAIIGVAAAGGFLLLLLLAGLLFYFLYWKPHHSYQVDGGGFYLEMPETSPPPTFDGGRGYKRF